MFRLLLSRPANRPQERCPPTNLQISLVLTHPYLTKCQAGRHPPSTSSMDTDSDTDISDRLPVDLFVEEGELSDQDLEASAAASDLTLSEEQNYIETMSGIRSFMGWSHIPEMDTAASRSDDNPFAGPKTQPTGKVSVSMRTDEWLCSKMGKLNITLTEGYPSRSSEAGGLLKDQFVCPQDLRRSGTALFRTDLLVSSILRLYILGVRTHQRSIAPTAV